MSAASWLRSRRNWALIALAALALYALFGFFVVPRILESRIVKLSRKHLDRQATVTRVRFNPFTLAVEVDGFRLADRDGGDLLAFDRLRIDLQVSGAFRRALRFRTILIEGPVVTIRILEDGQPSFADLLERGAALAEPEPPAGLPRLIIERLALGAGTIVFSDRSRQPAFESRFEPLQLDARDLITLPEESGQHSIAVGLGNGAEVRWSGQHTVEPLEFTGRFEITGLDLVWLWGYVGHAQPLEVGGGRADITLPYSVRKQQGQAAEVALDGAALAVHELVVRPRGGTEDWLGVPELEFQEVQAT